MPVLYAVMGKSASGKDTVFKRLAGMPELGLKTAIPYTTRPAREGEMEGREYYFADEARLNRLLAEGRVIERRTYHTVCGVWHYFTAEDGQIKLDSGDYIMITTPEGFLQLRDYYGKNRTVPLYIEVEDGERLLRALERERKQRTPRYAELCRRYLADEEDFSEARLKDLGIAERYCNQDLEACIRRISGNILKFREGGGAGSPFFDTESPAVL